MINLSINFENLQKQLIDKHNFIKKKIKQRLMNINETHHHNGMSVLSGYFAVTCTRFVFVLCKKNSKSRVSFYVVHVVQETKWNLNQFDRTG